MDYNNQNIKLSKRVADEDGHSFYIDHDSARGRCPVCGKLVTVPLYPVRNYRVTRIDRDVDPAAPRKFILVTPDTTTRIHMVFSAISENPIVREFFEDATIEGGDKMTEMDNNRDDPQPSELSVFENPIIGVEGTKLYERRVTNGLDRVLTDITPQSEVILKQNMTYLIKLTPDIVSTISTIIRWAEVK